MSRKINRWNDSRLGSYTIQCVGKRKVTKKQQCKPYSLRTGNLPDTIE